MTPPRTTTTPAWDTLGVGDELPTMTVDVTATRIVAGAIADRDYANAQGAPDIFMNILSDTGYSSRFLTDWAGPDALVRRLSLRLGVPMFPGGTLVFTGTVTGLDRDGDEGVATVGFRAVNDLGDHLTGTADVGFPVPEAP